MPTEELFGNYNFFLEGAGGLIGTFTMFKAEGTPVRAEAKGTAVAMETLTLSHEGFEAIRQFFDEGGRKLYVSRADTDGDGAVDDFLFHSDPDPAMAEILVPSVYVEEIATLPPRLDDQTLDRSGDFIMPEVGDEVVLLF